MKLRRFIVYLLITGLLIPCAPVQAKGDGWGAAIAKGALTYYLNKPTKKSVGLAGDGLALEYRAKYRTYHDPELTAILEENVLKAREVNPLVKMPDIMAIDMKDDKGKSETNAFAIPGSQGSTELDPVGAGYIFITNGLVDLAKSKSQDYRSTLSGIINHELGHLTLNHAKEAWKSALAGQVIVETALAGAGVGKNTASIVRLAEFAREKKYSRKDEMEADQFAWDNYPAKYDRKAFPAFFRTLKAESGDIPQALSWASDHPMLDDRASRYEGKYTEEPPNVVIEGPVVIQEASSRPNLPEVRIVFTDIQMSGRRNIGGSDQFVAWINQGLIGSGISVVLRGRQYEQARREQQLEGIDPSTRVEPDKFYGATGGADVIVSCTTGYRDRSFRASGSPGRVSKGKKWFFVDANSTITNFSFKTLDVRDVTEASSDEVLVTDSRTDVNVRIPGRRGRSQRVDVSVDQGGDNEQVLINNTLRQLANRLSVGLRTAFDRLPNQETSCPLPNPALVGDASLTTAVQTEPASYVVFSGNQAKNAKVGQLFAVYSWDDSMVDRNGFLISRGRQLGTVRVVSFNTSPQIAAMSNVPWNSKYKNRPIGVWVRPWCGTSDDEQAGLIFIPL